MNKTDTTHKADVGFQGHTFKVVPVGDGSLYGWKEFDKDGATVKTSEQNWSTEADAEKAMRAIVSSQDKIEVKDIKNINPGSNRNVNLVRDPEEAKARDAGMTRVDAGIEEGSTNGEEVVLTQVDGETDEAFKLRTAPRGVDETIAKYKARKNTPILPTKVPAHLKGETDKEYTARTGVSADAGK